MVWGSLYRTQVILAPGARIRQVLSRSWWSDLRNRGNLEMSSRPTLPRQISYRQVQNTDGARAPSVFWIWGPPVFCTTWHNTFQCTFTFWTGPKLIWWSIKCSKSVCCTASILNFSIQEDRLLTNINDFNKDSLLQSFSREIVFWWSLRDRMPCSRW